MRNKIMLVFGILTVLLVVTIYFHLRSYFNSYFKGTAKDLLERSIVIYKDAKALSYTRLREIVEGRANTKELKDIFAPFTDDEIKRTLRELGRDVKEGESIDSIEPELLEKAKKLIIRRRAFAECEAFAVVLKAPEYMNRSPELVAIIDENGIVIARNLNPNADPVQKDLKKELVSVQKALQGKSVADIWKYREFLLAVGVAPIIREGKVKGALLVGFDISNGIATEDSKLFGVGVTFMYKEGDKWKVHSSSVGKGPRRDDLNEEVQKLPKEEIEEILSSKEIKYISFELLNERFFGVIGRLPVRTPHTDAAFMLLTSVDEVLEPTEVLNWLWLYLGITLVLIVIASIVLTFHFLKPVEEIEEGLLRIINGDYKYKIDVKSEEVGGLGYRINQLVSVLLGEKEEVEEE